MSGFSQPEAPLAVQRAFAKAARKYGLEPAVLYGIWQHESSSTYPNPYSNGLGYGGELGTSITAPWGTASQTRYTPEPPIQQQADTAASILARQLRGNGGDMAKALSAYSGGGYSTLPGVPGFAAPSTAAPFAGLSTRPRPGVGIGIDTSHGVGGFLSSVFVTPWESLLSGGQPGSPEAKVVSEITGVVDFLRLAAWLVSPFQWLRAVEALFGFVLLLAGLLVILGADKALKQLPGPTGAAAKLAGAA